MNGSRQFSPSFCPQIRKEIVFGPAQRSGRAMVYHLKDRFTNWVYRVGAKEYFLIHRMDGTRTLGEIGEEYQKHFGRKLEASSWGMLFDLLEKRQLLADTATATGLEELRKKLELARIQDNRQLFRRRFPFAKPDAFLEKVLPWVRFAFHPIFASSALVVLAFLEIFIYLNWRAIGGDAWASTTDYPVLIAFLIFFWLAITLHEISHGLACKYFGGSASEIGIMWRYLTFVPYCKTDDVVLFHNRSHRFYSAFAGIFSNLLLLLPIGLLWWFSPNESVKSFSALGLIAINSICLVSLIPFVEMDGYFMLNHILDMVDLRKQANIFWREMVLKVLLRQGNGISGYDRGLKFIYFFYGFFSIIFTAAFIVVMAFFWFTIFYRWFDVYAIWALLIVLLTIVWTNRHNIVSWLRENMQLGVKRSGVFYKKDRSPVDKSNTKDD